MTGECSPPAELSRRRLRAGADGHLRAAHDQVSRRQRLQPGRRRSSSRRDRGIRNRSVRLRRPATALPGRRGGPGGSVHARGPPVDRQHGARTFRVQPGWHAGRLPPRRAGRRLRRRRYGCAGQRRHRRGDPAGPAGRPATRPRGLVRSVGHRLRFDGSRPPWLRSRGSGHRGQHRRLAPGLPPAGGYLGQVRQRGDRRGIRPRRRGGDALRQGRLHCLGGVRILRSQAGRVARLFIGDDPGRPGLHVGADRRADAPAAPPPRRPPCPRPRPPPCPRPR